MAFDGEQAAPVDEEMLAEAFRTFIQDRDFPCVGAKAALSRGQMQVLVGRDIRSGWDDVRVHGALHDLARRYKEEPKLFQSFAVLFQGPDDLTETEFERHLWDRLQSLTDKDVWHGHDHDPRVAPTPDSPHFSLSFGGEAFFAVGLHPHASREARRFARPAIVFNLHDQFERLRADGVYDKLRRTILERDEALQGSINPMLARHGEGSEARQYSGRQVDEAWRCPLQRDTLVGGLGADLDHLLP